MSKGGYSKLLQKFQESLAANQRLEQQVQEQGRQIAELQESATAASEHDVAEPAKEPSSIEKVLLFFEHGLSLTAVGIAGPLMVPLSNWFLLLPAACFVGAFHRVGVVRGKPRIQQAASYLLIALIGIATGYGIHVAIEKQEDQFISRLGAFLRREERRDYPVLILPDPQFRVEPMSGLNAPSKLEDNSTAFMATAHNLLGADITHIAYYLEYFVASADSGNKESSVRFVRYFSSSNALMSNFNLPLEQNDRQTFYITPTKPGDFLPVLMAPEKGVLKTACVRLTFQFERSSDHKSYSYRLLYKMGSYDSYKTISNVLTETPHFPSVFDQTMLFLSDIQPHLDDISRWQEAGWKVEVGQDRKQHLSLITKPLTPQQ